MTDATSGVADSGLRYFLDGDHFDGDEIDLTELTAGEHTFRVEATDRAGTKSTQSVTFSIDGSGTGTMTMMTITAIVR